MSNRLSAINPTPPRRSSLHFNMFDQRDSAGHPLPRRTTSVMYSNLDTAAPPVPSIPSSLAERDMASSPAPMGGTMGRSASMARARTALQALGGRGNGVSNEGAASQGGGYRHYFRRYELMIEYTNLANLNHCPTGMYILPDPTTPSRLWHGVLFLSRGYYKDAIFRFQLHIPDSYPQHPPTVQFLTDVYHPLVNAERRMTLTPRFPQWRPRTDKILHILHFIKDAFHRKVLDTLAEDACANKEAIHLLRHEVGIFGRLAKQSARMSTQDANIYGAGSELGGIVFTKMTDKKFEEVKREMLGMGEQTE